MPDQREMSTRELLDELNGLGQDLINRAYPKIGERLADVTKPHEGSACARVAEAEAAALAAVPPSRRIPVDPNPLERRLADIQARLVRLEEALATPRPQDLLY